jgi:site-specific DNA-cytosine methylase
VWPLSPLAGLQEHRGYQCLARFGKLWPMGSTLISGRDFLKIRDAARLIGVSEKTLRNWDRLGHLRAHRHPINGYRLYRTADLHALLERISELPGLGSGEAQQFELRLFEPTDKGPAVLTDELAPCHWSREVALDPKHRPQKWSTPSTTVRRDWRKFPQEAHVLDEGENRYRRLSVKEIALLQGLDPALLCLNDLTEREKIAAIGDAVPPPLAIALVTAICAVWPWRKRTAVEICAGIGGLAEGAAASGLKHLLLLDTSAVSVKLLQRNRVWAADCVCQTDIRSYDFSRLRGQVGLLSGGAPCQPWSQAGHRLGAEDARNVLGSTPELVSTIRPEVFLFENVPGLALFSDGSYLRDLVWSLRQPAPGLKYGVVVALLNAADFGLPQIRKRIFILGFRDGPGALADHCFNRLLELQTHRDPALSHRGLPAWRTVGELLRDRDDPGGWRRWIGSGLE